MAGWLHKTHTRTGLVDKPINDRPTETKDMSFRRTESHLPICSFHTARSTRNVGIPTGTRAIVYGQI